MQLPRWVRHPYATLRDVLPTRRQVLYAAFGSRKGRAVTVLVVYGLLAGVYLSKQLPYPAVGETEGWIAYYELSSTQRGALAYGMLSGLPAYLGAQKALQLVYSPDENVLRVLDTQGNYEQTWVLGDETLADMDVIGGQLTSRQTQEGKIWYCLAYNPDKNRAVATWQGSLDSGQVWTSVQNLHTCLTDTQEAARERDRLLREQPEIVRKSVRKEMKRWIDSMDDVDPIVSGDGYAEAVSDTLGRDVQGTGNERDEQVRRQRDSSQRQQQPQAELSNGDSSDDVMDVSDMAEQLQEGET
jgi:hypothetical protein